jgi:hypothetical protein
MISPPGHMVDDYNKDFFAGLQIISCPGAALISARETRN